MDEKELTLQQIQQGSYQVLLKFKEICEKNSFRYWLAYGTLIGAIRHKGFIPWDDDIDVQMPREDYEKFVDYCIANKDSLKPFELHHYRTNKKYIYPIARLSDSRYSIDYLNTKEYGLGLFIDIYPVDEVDIQNKDLAKKRRKYMRRIGYAGVVRIEINKGIIQIVRMLYFVISRFFNSNKLLAKYDSLFKSNRFGKGNYGCYIWENKLYDVKKEWYSFDSKVSFNGEMFPVPQQYDLILKTIYGDYMSLPPESDRVPHHEYKSFKKESTK